VARSPGEWVNLRGVRKSDRTAQSIFSLFGFDFLTVIPSIVGGAFYLSAMSLPAFELSQQRLRVGRRSCSFADIDSCHLDVETVRGSRNLSLRFGQRGRFELTVLLRVGDELGVDAETQRDLLAVFAASSIAMPTDRYDPTGRYIRSTFPTNVTKDEAIELVRNPPLPHEPLPVAG
jgi:hypothetical protein